MYYNHYDRYGGDRLSASSVVLLVIFVCAASFIVAAILWRPWFDDDASRAVQLPAAEAPADPAADESAAQPPPVDASITQ
jgi:hypothetical protein